MKCQILFSGKKNTNLWSAELAQRVVKVKQNIQTGIPTYTVHSDQTTPEGL